MNSALKLIIDVIQSKNIPAKSFLKFKNEILIKLLEDNRVLSPFLKNLPSSDDSMIIDLHSEIEHLIQRDYVVDIDEKTKIFSEFLKKLKVPWMSHKHLFIERQRADIDILVPESKFNFVLSKMEEDGFEKIAIEPSKIKLKKIHDSSNFTIHLHEKIIWETEFIDTLDVWTRSREIFSNGLKIKIPKAEDSILIECAHAFFESRLIRLSDVLQFIEINNRDAINWEQIHHDLQKYGFQAAGYLYFLALDIILTKIFTQKLIPSDFIEHLYEIVSNEEKFFAVNRAQKIMLNMTDTPLPFPIDLNSSAMIFLIFNRRRGAFEFFNAIKVLSTATYRHFLVKIGVKKL